VVKSYAYDNENELLSLAWRGQPYMMETEKERVAELVSCLEEAVTVLEACTREMRKLPGNGAMAGIMARSTANRIMTILENAAADPFIVTPSQWWT
jgi:hypothetical protein